MGTYENFKDNDKYSESRTDIYNPSFESPVKPSDENGNIVDRHIEEFTELCSFLRFIE